MKAVPLYKRALLTASLNRWVNLTGRWNRAKALRGNVLASKKRRMVLVEVLAERGVHVSLVELLSWTLEDQGKAYLWARELEPEPPEVLGPAVNRTVYNRLCDAGVRLYPEDVAGWSSTMKRRAFEWANAFALGQEDLPEPEFVACLPRKTRGNLPGRILA